MEKIVYNLYALLYKLWKNCVNVHTCTKHTHIVDVNS